MFRFGSDGALQYTNGAEPVGILAYTPGRWYNFELEIDATPFGSFTLKVDGNVVAENIPLAEAVKSVERISFVSKPFGNCVSHVAIVGIAQPPSSGLS